MEEKFDFHMHSIYSQDGELEIVQSSWINKSRPEIFC